MVEKILLKSNNIKEHRDWTIQVLFIFPLTLICLFLSLVAFINLRRYRVANLLRELNYTNEFIFYLFLEVQ